MLEKQLLHLGFLVAFISPQMSRAAETADNSDTELNRRIEILAQEINNLKLGEVAAKADQIQYGMGPAASKVYRQKQGVSIGGYGELVYQNFDRKKDDNSAASLTDQIDLQRVVLYFGYKFSDRLTLNTEIEFEHASSASNLDGKKGSWGLEFAYLDYQVSSGLNFRAGNLLIPMGWVNELHEPTVFLGVRRPDVEQKILPSTWRENGLGVYGDISSLSYRSYIINGFDAGGCRSTSCDNKGFEASGIRGGRQNGSYALAQDLSWVSRLDWNAAPGATLGVAYFMGDAGQDQTNKSIPDLPIQIADLHFEFRRDGWEIRALGAMTWIKNAAEFNAAKTEASTGAGGIGSKQYGFYGQLGRSFSMKKSSGLLLTPFLRYEQWNTQADVASGFSPNPAQLQRSLTSGAQFKIEDQVVVTGEYQNLANGAGTGLNQFNLGLGFIF